MDSINISSVFLPRDSILLRQGIMTHNLRSSILSGELIFIKSILPFLSWATNSELMPKFVPLRWVSGPLPVILQPGPLANSSKDIRLNAYQLVNQLEFGT